MKKPWMNLNQAGQATMEAVLILVVVVGLATKISSEAKSSGFVRKLTEGPWATIRGMVEDGVWVNYADSKPLHPNHKIRHQSTLGDST